MGGGGYGILSTSLQKITKFLEPNYVIKGQEKK